MELQYLVAFLVCVTALASFLNYHLVKLPKTIGLTIISLSLSLGLMFLVGVGAHWVEVISTSLASINFSDTVINGMLSYLLFAGALHINAVELKRHRKMVISMATVSVAISTVLVGYITFLFGQFFNLDINLAYCLVFGALISPTDPISVIGVMKTTNAPHSVRMKITGEALFNDAASIVLFVLLLEIAQGQGRHLDYSTLGIALVEDGVGGVGLGYILGIITSYFLRHMEEEETAILMTLALVTGGYSIATALNVSGPICMVMAGLVVGSQSRKLRFAPQVVTKLFSFWSLVDDMLNSFLFVMIGLEIMSINVKSYALLVGFSIFFFVVLTRFVSIAIPFMILEPIKHFRLKTVSLMTWSGLRGGLSIALALSIGEGPHKDLILTITYVVVIISIILQGLTLQPFINRLFPPPKSKSKSK